ncbi:MULTISPECIES: 16S rRNA (uracil(1498)-N(3))-methyltransferase [Flavobacterium]|jgi:16S rRNA (uracil1498-N3)-methyltransferase|uniref:Ribosomal RNA small subunit methyltransferase E n=1 Tax=Flavobacterium lindanitolerans TaxID=428988 RepID=A0A497UDE2_9FLAO|nr:MULTISPECIES: 16S rRNA (uracil(1498)-N(3))-methyltransferase [Flavobacterium]THD32543.1 MAG: 16S rRNA (uracil(1498)-N(3))-methyltransferase [Flavobacterium johnsoniae]MBC8644764.1 16S rRNA (uracil(1498)-N(3))-methyltransferase [Flavobacterium lindanitolerans]MBL7868750.1 16S rRNA (uracil(1498)-N(3))-methyltransferase [Flavobacterium lindanitolerans]MDQ7960938.1 16S rRNA (uracil(1498)-N(3))-methyltransferase [Flavobacterium lindanitolerans]OJX55792.1 MAG: 16S rRNA (uracil(1498)-N(3))-methylt
MQLFYNPTITTATETFFFDKEESKHIVKVLRKKEGDNLYVTNGLGYLFKTEIALASDSKCLVKIIGSEKGEATGYKLHLAVAPTKMNDRFEWFLEKATEIGIGEITPIICDHSERKVVKTDRFDKIILSAMKQSLHYYLPKLNEPVSFKDFIKQQQNEGLKLIAHCEETQKKSLKETVLPNQDVTILIGPEGDFSEKEIKLAVENNYIPVTLGNTRLRTETAAVVACHSVVFINEK